MSTFFDRAQASLSASAALGSGEETRWTPEEGDTLVGSLVDVRTIEGQWGEFHVAAVQVDDVIFSVAESATLRDMFAEAEKMTLPCRVAIKFNGVKTGRQGREYRHYGWYLEPAPAPAAPVQQQAPVPAPAPTVQQQAPAGVEAFGDTAASLTQEALAELAGDGRAEVLIDLQHRAAQVGLHWDRGQRKYVA